MNLYRFRLAGNERGFSLLEAIVAMAIATIAFVALYRTVGQSSVNAVAIDDRVQAALVARSVLASATFAEDLAKVQTGHDGVWEWSLQISPEQIAAVQAGRGVALAPMPAARVEVQVSRAGRAVLAWAAWKPYRSAP